MSLTLVDTSHGFSVSAVRSVGLLGPFPLNVGRHEFGKAIFSPSVV